MSRDYGLTGKTVKVSHKAGHTDAYPWNGIAVPILIIGEYPNIAAICFLYVLLSTTGGSVLAVVYTQKGGLII